MTPPNDQEAPESRTSFIFAVFIMVVVWLAPFLLFDVFD